MTEHSRRVFVLVHNPSDLTYHKSTVVLSNFRCLSAVTSVPYMKPLRALL